MNIENIELDLTCSVLEPKAMAWEKLVCPCQLHDAVAHLENNPLIIHKECLL